MGEDFGKRMNIETKKLIKAQKVTASFSKLIFVGETNELYTYPIRDYAFTNKK